MYINQAENLFSSQPVFGSGWEFVSIDEFNALRASGWNPNDYVPPYRVSKDTITSRVLDAGKLPDLMTLIAGLPAEQQFLWTNYAWFWSNNQTALAMCAQLGLDPAVILAPDPYLT